MGPLFYQSNCQDSSDFTACNVPFIHSWLELVATSSEEYHLLSQCVAQFPVNRIAPCISRLPSVSAAVDLIRREATTPHQGHLSLLPNCYAFCAFAAFSGAHTCSVMNYCFRNFLASLYYQHSSVCFSRLRDGVFAWVFCCHIIPVYFGGPGLLILLLLLFCPAPFSTLKVCT
ncbi:hypothetical protein BJ508DRAFT_177726 [Ascobolus immersus RN42]|uniref:Uncharacterized protein n=1 Tax=Ascobolus immersus RN42 TaxID=1160509 RepID=A0A3N4II58_ASCIM|nr:hypothetical protein BJ508DRAFT_177726 [Ascobolus immersus RN42]